MHPVRTGLRRWEPMTARTRISLALAFAALLGACDVLPFTSPAPSPGTRPENSPQTVQPLGPQDIVTAIDGLDELDSYRFEGTLAEGPQGASMSRGTVINGDVRRTRIEYSAGGAFTGATITISDRTWLRVSGSTYEEQDGAAGLGTADWVNPVALQLDPWSLGITVVEDLGIDDRGGVQARHLHGSVIAGDVLDDDGNPVGIGFGGTVDVWIAVDGGYLVAAAAVGTEAMPNAGETDPATTPTAYALDIAVDGVNDPANVIEAPIGGAATPAPDGDPVALRVIKGIAAGQASLDSYVYSITSSTSGFDISSTLTVVNRPVAAAQVETDAVAGFDAMVVLVIGDRSWSRTGPGAWQAASAGEMPACGVGADALSDPAPCTLSRLTDLGSTIRAARRTFVVISTDEQVAGIDTTHLRSQSGVPQGEDVIPGTRDVWVANERGYVVRDVFTGLDVSFESVIGRVNDIGNRLVAPAR